MRRFYSLAIIFLSMLYACRTTENPAVWQKVRFQFDQLDREGLTGPPGGKVALNYEFCIPADTKSWRMVQRIDTTARQYEGSRGRIGCQKGQLLVIGSTHQPNYKRVLYQLAQLPFVERMEPTFWE